jgi:hypothetical protein
MGIPHNAMSPATRLNLIANFDILSNGKEVLAKAVCERRNTPGRFTVARTLRVFWFSIVLAACGGGHRGDTYAKATNAEQECCEHLQGDPRAACLQKIVRIDDAAKSSSTNQSTYACVSEHFTCDASTGHATHESAQAQIDCIQDLQ